MTTPRRVHGVFLGPIEIAGYFARLRIGLEAVGVRSMYVDLAEHPFLYVESPPANRITRLARLSARRGHAGPRPVRAYWKFVSVAARTVILLRALLSCDTFVFGAAHTLLGRRELPLLRLLGKRIVVIFFGSEIRPSYLDGIEAGSGATPSPSTLVAATRRKRSRVRGLERYADAIVSHGPMSHLLARPFVSWLEIGIPTTPDDAGGEARAVSGPVRVLHAPSDTGAKGTAEIRATVTSLIDEGLPIEYLELRKLPNAEVRAALSGADIVVDQLYSDTPMAVLASEAAAAGRPAIVGSLDWVGALDRVSHEATPPTVRCSPEELEPVLRRLVASAAEREKLGRHAREFVTDRWNPEAVARRFLAVCDGTAPVEWMRSPADIEYVSGAGLSRARLASVLAAIASEPGEDPFCVGDKPQLVARLQSAATGAPSTSDSRMAPHRTRGPAGEEMT